MLKAKLGTLTKQFEQLSRIHSRCRGQKKKDFVGTQTLTDDEVPISSNDEVPTIDEVIFAMY